jgi:hypothetical protein
VTVDGVDQGPSGPTEDASGDFPHGGGLVPFFDDALGRYTEAIFGEVDAFVLGRRTYEIFAASWPKATDPDDPIAADLTSTPSGVTMQTLELTGPPEYGEVELE